MRASLTKKAEIECLLVGLYSCRIDFKSVFLKQNRILKKNMLPSVNCFPSINHPIQVQFLVLP